MIEIKGSSDRLLNVKQVSDKLGIARSTVYYLIGMGELTSFKMFKQKGIRVFKSSVDDYVRRKKAEVN